MTIVRRHGDFCKPRSDLPIEEDCVGSVAAVVDIASKDICMSIDNNMLFVYLVDSFNYFPASPGEVKHILVSEP